MEKELKPKKILRFYFGADSLERAFDNLIMSKALDFEGDALETADKLCGVIGEKMKLERLWAYLDAIVSTFSDEERRVLAAYSARRDTPLSDADSREAKRVVIKFTRRARRLGEFAESYSVIKKYYCLIKSVKA